MSHAKLTIKSSMIQLTVWKIGEYQIIKIGRDLEIWAKVSFSRTLNQYRWTDQSLPSARPLYYFVEGFCPYFWFVPHFFQTIDHMRTLIKSMDDRRLGKTVNTVVEGIKIQRSKPINSPYWKRWNFVGIVHSIFRSKN